MIPDNLFLVVVSVAFFASVALAVSVVADAVDVADAVVVDGAVVNWFRNIYCLCRLCCGDFSFWSLDIRDKLSYIG